MKTYSIRCRITNGAQTTRVDVFDDIGGGFGYGVSAQDFSNAIGRLTGPVDVHINSGGGDVFQGVAIAETLRTYKGRITTYVDGLAASVASVIAQSGIERVMAPGSMMMIHDAYTYTEGNQAEHEHAAKTLGKVSDSIADIYARRSGGDKNSWRDRMLAETWYTAEEAVAAGLADRVGGESAAWPEGLETAAFAKAPDRIMANIRRLSARSTLRIRQAVMHGDHELYDPDGNGDCDACPEGDTDHSHFDENGKQIKPIPGKPMPGEDSGKKAKVKGAKGIDNSEWNADKAWHAGAESDDPAAFYAAICAGRKDGDPSEQSSWALPYRYSPSSPPNSAAVRNALARLDQTEGLTNKEAAQAKLEKLMKKINPDYEPSASLAALLLSTLGKGATQ